MIVEIKRELRKHPELLQNDTIEIDKNDGCIMLEPRELTVPESISARTLEDMDKAINNFKMGNVSETIDLSDF